MRTTPAVASIFFIPSNLPAKLAGGGVVRVIPAAPPFAFTKVMGGIGVGSTIGPLAEITMGAKASTESRITQLAFTSGPHEPESPPTVGTVRPRLGVGASGILVHDEIA